MTFAGMAPKGYLVKSFLLGDQVFVKGSPGEQGAVVAGPRTGADGASYEVFFARSEGLGSG